MKYMIYPVFARLSRISSTGNSDDRSPAANRVQLHGASVRFVRRGMSYFLLIIQKSDLLQSGYFQLTLFPLMKCDYIAGVQLPSWGTMDGHAFQIHSTGSFYVECCLQNNLFVIVVGTISICSTHFMY